MRHDSHSISDNKTTLATWTQTLTPIHIHQSKDTYYKTKYTQLEMWANAQRDGRPAEHRWRPLFDAANSG